MAGYSSTIQACTEPRSIQNLSHRTRLAGSRAESLCRASFCFCGLFLSTLRRCIRLERTQKPGRNTGNFIHGGQERAFVCLRRFVKPADFSHELERSSSNFLGSYGRIEVEEGFDVPAHSLLL